MELNEFYIKVLETPGHCPDHVSFKVSFKESPELNDTLLFSGDNILGYPSTKIENYG